MRMIRTAVLAMAMGTVSAAFAQPPAAGADVRAFVEDFLLRLGDARYDTLDRDFLPQATILVTRRQRDGAWTTNQQTAEAWLAGLKKNPNPTHFREPLTNVQVTIDSDQLAYLRGDFQVMLNGKPASSGVDQFTLVREGTGWRFAAIAYTSMPTP